MGNVQTYSVNGIDSNTTLSVAFETADKVIHYQVLNIGDGFNIIGVFGGVFFLAMCVLHFVQSILMTNYHRIQDVS